VGGIGIWAIGTSWLVSDNVIGFATTGIAINEVRIRATITVCFKWMTLTTIIGRRGKKQLHRSSSKVSRFVDIIEASSYSITTKNKQTNSGAGLTGIIQDGIKLAGTGAVADSNMIVNTVNSGIRLTGTNQLVTKNSVTSSGSYGIFIENNDNGGSISNNTINGTSYGIAGYYFVKEIVRNTISNAEFDGIQICKYIHSVSCFCKMLTAMCNSINNRKLLG